MKHSAFLHTLVRTFKGQKQRNPNVACANCWGYQEYSDKVRKHFRLKQIDIRNKVSKNSFINAFVAVHIDGIK